MNRTRKTGICITGPACSVWKRSAMPLPHSVAVRLTSSARDSSPSSCDRIAVDVHAGDQRRGRDDGAGEQEAHGRRKRVARDDPLAPRRAQHQAAAEARLEVGRGREPREDAAECGRLEEHEHELEGGVAGREVEARHVADVRQAAGEGDEEEQREDDRRDQERRVLEGVDEVAAQHRARDGREVARSCARHPRGQGPRRRPERERSGPRCRRQGRARARSRPSR